MRGLLLDTHVWLWYMSGDEHLRRRTRKLIDDSLEDCWLSPVTIWETGVLRELGKIRIREDFRSWVETSRKRVPFRPAPFNHEVALAVSELDLEHRDPADRFLAATAQVYDLRLLTVDRRLLEAQSVPTLAA